MKHAILILLLSLIAMACKKSDSSTCETCEFKILKLSSNPSMIYPPTYDRDSTSCASSSDTTWHFYKSFFMNAHCNYPTPLPDSTTTFYKTATDSGVLSFHVICH